jgi:hypothetical protein
MASKPDTKRVDLQVRERQRKKLNEGGREDDDTDSGLRSGGVWG